MKEEKEKSMIDELEEMFKSGQLHRLVKLKIISSDKIVWRNLYHAFNFRMETTGSKMQAYSDVSINFDMSEDHVRYIIRTLGELTTNEEKNNKVTLKQ